MDILRLYNEAKHDQLDQQEIAWLESLANKYPWYSLPHTILAKYHVQNHSTIKDRALQRAATYALSRAVLKGYIMGTEANSAPIPTYSTISKAETPEISEKEANIEAVVEGTEAIVADAEETTSQEIAENITETSAKEESTEHTEAISEVQETETAEEAVVAEKEIEAEVEEIAAEAEIVSEQGEVDLESEQTAENAESDAETAEELVKAEEEAQPILEKASEAPVVPTTAPTSVVGKVNWYLETRVSMRASKYVRLAGKLKQEMGAYATSVNGNGSEKAVQPETVVEAVAPPLEELVEKVITEERPQPESSPTLAETIQKPAIEAKAEGIEENEYQIGSFSGFTFLTESGAEKDVEEIDSEIVEAEAVESAVGEGDEATEIIFEERDRVVEITVTPEQLAKYFRGKAPQTKVSAEEAMEPFELGLDADSSQTNEKPTKEKVDELIDKFIETDPTLSNPHSFQASKGNLAAKSSREPDDLVTETLAKIHAMQGNYAKAAKIYKKLSLLFPEKSDYFADQIKNLKK